MVGSTAVEDRSPDRRSAIALAAQWVARIITIAFEMVLPGLLGFWVDGWLGTRVLFALAGFAVGVTIGVWHLVQIGKGQSGGQSRAKGP